MIKKLFSVLLFLCLFQSVVYSYTLEVTEWDQTEDTKLYNKLENEFYIRHYIDEHHTSAGVDSYYKEVLEPYIKQSKNISDLPQKQYKIETK